MGAVSGLERLHNELGWPEPATVLAPEGGGAEMFGRLAREKVGASLARRVGKDAIRVGIVVSDAASSDTDPPLAIICEFAKPALSEDLYEAHRLAWNFCHAPVLITVDPYEIRTWSCFVAPQELFGQYDSAAAELTEIRGHTASDVPLAQQAANSLHWISMVSGRLIQDHPESFRPEGRADRILLQNLKHVRRRLITGTSRLEADLAHDLIARLMFVQFLFDRKDAGGTSALNRLRLQQLWKEGILKKKHSGLASILADHGDAYSLFRWLDKRFNGDFFPRAQGDVAKAEAAWQHEMKQVKPDHLAVLSDLVSGRLEVSSGQMSLWRLYSFDTIPLEFVSSIYEEFVTPPAALRVKAELTLATAKTGIYYTPTHLVDFVLDSVLPWHGEEWDLRVLDPACGSGIFLVRVFQRLVHRWRRRHQSDNVPVPILTRILEDNLFGVDINPHAARVASFSLYLAMCDEIDPRRYWTEVKFPTLRDKRIITADFFSEQSDGFDTEKDANHYDFVVGNAPWGERTLSESALTWSSHHSWPVLNKDVGALFLGKALVLTKDGGQIAMIQSAGTLLTNAKSATVRQKLFAMAQVDEVVNFTLLRFHLFPTAVSPACSISLTKRQPDGSPTTYICPKLSLTPEDSFRITVDEIDVHAIEAGEICDPWVWTVLLGGTRRDLNLLRRLRQQGKTLREYTSMKVLQIQEGVVPGPKSPVHPKLKDRPVLFSRDFPPGTWLRLHSRDLPRQEEIRTHRQTNAGVFETPQLIIKQTWRIESGRFRAVFNNGSEGIVCSQSYLSGHASSFRGVTALKSACLFINSRLAAYYLALTSGRMAYRPEMRPQDFYDLPIPEIPSLRFSNIKTFCEIDAASEDAFQLDENDQILVDDAFTYTIPQIVRDPASAGRLPTIRHGDGPTPGTLHTYADVMLRVLGSVSREMEISATVFEEGDDGGRLPVRLIAIHFGSIEGGGVRTEAMGLSNLHEGLLSVGTSLGLAGGRAKSVRRVATVFDVVKDIRTGKVVPTVYFLRPDHARYWTRAVALRDADRLMGEVLMRSALFARRSEATLG